MNMKTLIQTESSAIKKPYIVIDIETNSLNINDTHIYCICAIDSNNDEFVFTEKEPNYIKDFLDLCKNYEIVVAHNGVRFDFAVLHKYGFKAKVRDTFLDSKIIFPQTLLYKSDESKGKVDKNLKGSYSLKAFGQRIGNNKLDFDDWSKLTDEMITYCLQDCRVTKELYERINQSNRLPPYNVLYMEYKVAYLIMKQELAGFDFDIVKASKLAMKMLRKRSKIEYILKKKYPPKLVPKGTNLTPKLMKRKGVEIVGAYTNVSWQEFNPNSRQQIIDRLKDVWTPEVFTEKNTPVVNPDTLKNVKGARLLLAYLKLSKDLSQLQSGEGSLINNYNKETKKIHGKVDTLSCVTHRMSHNSPNLAQVAKDKDMRSLFHIEPSKGVYLGIDANALELMMFGHYLYKFGNSDYITSVSKGKQEDGTDVHTKTQKLIGLPTRSKAKTLIERAIV